MNNKKFSFIFKKKNFNKYKLIPLKINISDIGEKRYFPAISREWINNIYYFNNNNLKNLPVYDLSLKNILNNFFLSFFKAKLFNKNLFTIKRKSFNRIFISKPTIKHNNFKTVVTIFIYNRQIFPLKKNISNIYQIIKCIYLEKNISIISISELNYNLISLKEYILKYSLNKYKFEKYFFELIGNFINKFYMKKTEFNIINLKHFGYNNDIINEILALKLKKNFLKIFLSTDNILSRINPVNFKNKIVKTVLKKNFNNYAHITENKYKNLNLNYIIKTAKNNINKLLNQSYYNLNNKNRIKKLIFEFIKFKYIGGLKLEIGGRLTKHRRADRAVYVVKTKGRLKDINSSYKKLPLIKYRGYLDSNLEYSLYTSKRRVGAYAIKGWMTGI